MRKTGILLINLNNQVHLNDKFDKESINNFLLTGKHFDSSLWRMLFNIQKFITPSNKNPIALNESHELYFRENVNVVNYTLRLKMLLQEELGSDFQVEIALDNHDYTIKEVISRFYKEDVYDLVFLPIFPQYASTTIGLFVNKLLKEINRSTMRPTTKFVYNYHNHFNYIDSLVARLEGELSRKDYSHVIFSYYGIEEDGSKINGKVCNCASSSNLCYACACEETSSMVAERLNIGSDSFSTSYYKIPGKPFKVSPTTDDVIISQGKRKAKNILIISPSFVSGIYDYHYKKSEVFYQNLFKVNGGQNLKVLNGDSDYGWLSAVTDLLLKENNKEKELNLV
jgi:protoporphyrin/coproporphyrin ferrochelatase